MFESGTKGQLLHDRAVLRRSVMKPTAIALFLAFLFFGVGGYWSATAPIGSAAMATGTISPEGRRQTIQHLEGGIVRDIRVRDGARVESGDVLLVLEDTQALSAYRVQETRILALRAKEARLLAEEARSPDLDWSRVPDLPGRSAVIADQERIFVAQKNSQYSQSQIMGQRINQLREEITGLEAQIDSQSRQLGFIDDEIGMMTSLMDKGLTRKPQLLELQRQKAEISGQRAANVSAIARAEQGIGETRLEILNLHTARQDEAAKQLGEVRTELADLEERMAGTRDILQRTMITAPVNGTVFNLQANTIGGVLRPGDNILDIVPQEEELLIDARVTPIDIDDVYEGLTADVTLSALPQRNMPKLQGRVRQVSADRLIDENTGEPYYLARIEINQEQLQGLGLQEELKPGMPAETMIFTGVQTFFEYLVNPLIDSIGRSFREP